MALKNQYAQKKTAEDLFKEFADNANDKPEARPDNPDQRKPLTPTPFLRAIDALATIFEREVEAITAADFEKFKRLQGEKLTAIRNVERLQKSAQTLFDKEDRENLEARLRRFNVAVERNMKSLDAVRQATSVVHRYALKAVEEKQSDGVYNKDGSLKGLSCLSVNGNKIKL